MKVGSSRGDVSLSRSPPGRRSVRLPNACRLGGGIVARQSDIPKARRVRPVNHVFQTDRGRGMMFGAPS